MAGLLCKLGARCACRVPPSVPPAAVYNLCRDDSEILLDSASAAAILHFGPDVSIHLRPSVTDITFLHNERVNAFRNTGQSKWFRQRIHSTVTVARFLGTAENPPGIISCPYRRMVDDEGWVRYGAPFAPTESQIMESVDSLVPASFESLWIQFVQMNTRITPSIEWHRRLLGATPLNLFLLRLTPGFKKESG